MEAQCKPSTRFQLLAQHLTIPSYYSSVNSPTHTTMSHDSWVPVFLLTVLTVLGVPLLIVPLVLLIWRLVFCRRRDAALSDRIASRTHAVLTTETSSASGPKMQTVHIAGDDAKQREFVASVDNGVALATDPRPEVRLQGTSCGIGIG